MSAHAQEWDSKNPIVGACQPGTFLQGNLAVPLFWGETPMSLSKILLLEPARFLS